MTIKQIWKAIDEGKTVCWSNELYEVHPIECELQEYSKPTYRDGLALRCSCVDNYFGALLSESELSNCFVVNKPPKFKALEREIGLTGNEIAFKQVKS